jgi:two-component system, chemotaxis family, response regulator Rcp1
MNKQLKVLLIEDNLADANLASEFIEETGFDVKMDRIEDGEKAIEYFERVSKKREERPDVVLLDLNLPRKSGHEVLEYIRQHEGDNRAFVMIYTGSRSPEDILRAEKNKADGYLIKPMTADEIDAFIEDLECVFKSRGVSPKIIC